MPDILLPACFSALLFRHFLLTPCHADYYAYLFLAACLISFDDLIFSRRYAASDAAAMPALR